MYITGLSFAGFNGTSPTPTNIDRISSIELTKGIYDDVFLSNRSDLTYSTTIPQTWDFNTILHATFSNSLAAGNVDFNMANTTSLLIKRREKNTLAWQLIDEVPILNVDDCQFTKYDRFARSGVEYEYAIVPVTSGAEGNYNVSSITSSFEGIYIIDKDDFFHTILNITAETSKNKPTSVVTTLSGKYPYVISNSNNNYYSGNVSGVFVPYGCEYDSYEYCKQGGEYRQRLDDFLTNGKTKILKHQDGRMWMICITGEPSQSEGEHFYLPSTSFDFVEVGDYNSTEDLYMNGLIDLSEEWSVF